LAACQGYKNYLSWSFSKVPSDEVNFTTLCGVTICGLEKENEFAGLQLLLPVLKGGFFLNPYLNTSRYEKNESARKTIWSNTLYKAVVHLPHCLPPHKRSFGELLEVLLKSGADPSSRITCELEYVRFNIHIGGCVYHVELDKHPDFKETYTFINNKGGVSLYDLIDYWQLENSERLKELIDQRLAPKLEIWYSKTSNLGIEDLFTAESGEDNHNPKDEYHETELRVVQEEIEIASSSSVEVFELRSKENVRSQTSTGITPNGRRERLLSALKNPFTTFALGKFAVLEILWSTFLTFSPGMCFALILAHGWSLYLNSTVST
jgi:hypothetical protein